MITIVAKEQYGLMHAVRVHKESTKISKIYEAVCHAWRVKVGVLKLTFDGNKLVPDKRTADYAFEDGDQIDVSIEQRGC